jgi:hypothetical protein
VITLKLKDMRAQVINIENGIMTYKIGNYIQSDNHKLNTHDCRSSNFVRTKCYDRGFIEGEEKKVTLPLKGNGKVADMNVLCNVNIVYIFDNIHNINELINAVKEHNPYAF